MSPGEYTFALRTTVRGAENVDSRSIVISNEKLRVDPPTLKAQLTGDSIVLTWRAPMVHGGATVESYALLWQRPEDKHLKLHSDHRGLSKSTNHVGVPRGKLTPGEYTFVLRTTVRGTDSVDSAPATVVIPRSPLIPFKMPQTGSGPTIDIVLTISDAVYRQGDVFFEALLTQPPLEVFICCNKAPIRAFCGMDVGKTLEGLDAGGGNSERASFQV